MAGAPDITLDNALWRFVLPFYAREGIAPACLTLQDRLGVDVNVLLFAIFAQAEHGITLSEDDIVAVDTVIQDWRTEVIQPLRRVRSRMKSGPAPAPSALTERLRNRVKAAELDAEQIELAVLHDWLQHQQRPASSPANADTLRMVARYFARGAAFTPEVETALGTLSQAMAQ
jgi:uncharacterized protein (TIGR02444 family)